MKKPLKDGGGDPEAMMIEMKWTSKDREKVVLFVYHTTHNMRIQGKSANLWWEKVLKPVYEAILEVKGNELSKIQKLAKKNPEEAARAAVGVKKVQTKITTGGALCTRIDDKVKKKPETKKRICDVCREANIKKLSTCKSCNRTGHASCIKDDLCRECALKPEFAKKRRRSSVREPVDSEEPQGEMGE